MTVIPLGPSPTSGIISHFLDQWGENQRADKQAALQKQQLEQQASQHQDEFQIQQGQLGVQQGTLDDARKKLALAEKEYTDTGKKAEAQQYIDYMTSLQKVIATPGMDPARVAAAQGEMQSITDEVNQRTDLHPYIKINMVKGKLASMSAEETAKLGGDQAVANMTGRAAKGSTDPNDVAAALKVGPTAAYPTPQMFTQQQATDLTSRDAAPDSAGTPTPNLAQKVPAPSGNAVSDFEARSTGAMPTAPENLTAQTATTDANISAQAQRDVATIHAKSALDLANAKDAPTTGADPQVQNIITAVRGAMAKGLDPDTVLNRVKPNKDLYNAVINKLAEQGQGDALQSSVKGPQQTAIREIDPLIAQAKNVLAAYEPYKNDNGLTDRDTITYGLYMAGVKPDDGSPAAQLANLQMLRVQAGARLLKGGSRAYPALQMAMQHAGNGLVDTRANIYAKTKTLIEQLQRVRDSNAGTLETGDTKAPTDTGNPLGLTPPPGANP